MGVSSIDTKKKEREFKNLTLSDENVVKYLILYRSKVDMSYGTNTNVGINSAGDTFDFNQEVIALYASLDRLTKIAELTEKQKTLLELLYEGNTVNDSCQILNKHRSVIQRNFDRIVERIISANNEIWYYTTGKNGLILNTKER